MSVSACVWYTSFLAPLKGLDRPIDLEQEMTSVSAQTPLCKDQCICKVLYKSGAPNLQAIINMPKVVSTFHFFIVNILHVFGLDIALCSVYTMLIH